MNRPEPHAWHEAAVCADTPLELWYPGEAAGARSNGVPDEARELCDRCPVRVECLDHALRHERFGVWAATSERARARMRRNLRIRLVELDADVTAGAVLHLADNGTPPPAVAEQLGVTIRTVYRHLDNNGRGAPAGDHRRQPRRPA